jgi:hypothetical protein
MPRTPKEKPHEDKPGEDVLPTWEEDQKRREYYYDDAHGYEVYEAEDEEEDGDEEVSKK